MCSYLLTNVKRITEEINGYEKFILFVVDIFNFYSIVFIFARRISQENQYAPAICLMAAGIRKTAAASTAFREPVFFIYSDPKSGL